MTRHSKSAFCGQSHAEWPTNMSSCLRDIPLALAQPDLLEHSEDGLGILRHAELGQLLRLLTQAGEAGQQVEIPGGIGSGNSEKEDELHRPGAPGAPNDWLRRASEGKLQPLDPTQPRVWKRQAATKGRIGQ